LDGRSNKLKRAGIKNKVPAVSKKKFKMDEAEKKILQVEHKYEIYDLKLNIVQGKSEHALDQANHSIGLVISEQRHIERHSRDIEGMNKILEKHSASLYDNGKGHSSRIASLEQHRESNKLNLVLWISIAGLIIAILAIFLK